MVGYARRTRAYRRFDAIELLHFSVTSPVRPLAASIVWVRARLGTCNELNLFGIQLPCQGPSQGTCLRLVR